MDNNEELRKIRVSLQVIMWVLIAALALSILGGVAEHGKKKGYAKASYEEKVRGDRGVRQEHRQGELRPSRASESSGIVRGGGSDINRLDN